jgi:hypothetical protein
MTQQEHTVDQSYSFPDGPPGTTRHGHGIGTALCGTAARRAVPVSATVPKWQPRHHTEE